jgi:hypothetical protein
MHDFSTVKVFNLSDEMSLGFHSYFMSDLFDSENICPNKPNTPVGPLTGKINEELTFFTSTVDLDMDNIFYLFDWGDGSESLWLGPFNSGEECSSSHTLIDQGTYEVKVKAKDVYDAESEWSDPLIISIPKIKSLNVFYNSISSLIEQFPILKLLL